MLTDDRSRSEPGSDPGGNRSTATADAAGTIAVLPYPAAVLAPAGRIEAVNEAWNAFARRGGADPDLVGIGVNYLAICDAAIGNESAREAGRLIRDVLDGRRVSGSVEYECSPPGGPRRWFFLLASRLDEASPTRALVSHVNVTAIHEGADRERDREDRWTRLFDGQPSIVLLIDPDDGRILEATSLAADFYGIDADPQRSTRIAEIGVLAPDVVRESLRATLWSPGETRHRFPHRLTSGEIRIVDVYAGPVELDGRQVIRSVIHDVTDHATAEGERELLATAVRQASESVIITDVDGNIVYVNPAFEQVTGYTREEVMGRNPRLLRSGAHSPAFYASLWETLLASRTWSGELVNRRKDGSLFIEEARITPVFDDHGGLIHYVGVKRDVTVERAERAARERLAAIVESAADAAFALDLDGTLLAWNEAATRIFGFASDRVVGQTAFQVAPDAQHDPLRAILEEVGRGATVGPFDMAHHGAGDTTVTLSLTATPVRDADGRVTGIAAIARDVSAERALAAERATLESELRQAQKMEAVGRLAGGMAHDFNNLLTAISGYAAIVAEQLDGPLLDDQREILRAAERAADLTRRLLAFSRPVPINPRPVEIDAVLDEAYRMVSRLVPEPIEFVLRTGSGAWVEADPVELEQLLLNLVVNAADATDGSGRILVETSVQPGPASPDAPGDDRSHVLLQVEDSGRGMDEETRARIFEPFFTTKPTGHGTGLGLATVYGIVARTGGAVAVDSAPGRGTTFRVRLPIAVPPAAPEVPARPQSLSGTGHVLIVEDAPILRGLAARFLRSAGYRVTEAEGPAEVLERGVDDIDAIVTDVVMPTMSGPQLVRALGVDVPVVLMSGYPASLLPDDLGGVPHRTFIEKPFDRATLLNAVATVLAERAASG